VHAGGIMHVSIERLAERENAAQMVEPEEDEDALLLGHWMRTPAGVVVSGDRDRGCVVGGQW